MTDKDGKFTYSLIIRLTHNSISIIKIFSNPVKDVLIVNGLHQKGNIKLLSAEDCTFTVVSFGVLMISISRDGFRNNLANRKNIKMENGKTIGNEEDEEQNLKMERQLQGAFGNM